MAYMSQEKKKSIETKLKPVLKKYGVKGRLGVEHHSALVLTITEGALDFIAQANEHNRKIAERRGDKPHIVKDYYQENPHYCAQRAEGTKIGEFWSEVVPILNDGNHDNSDSQTDYFDVGWYVNINIGRWNKPYKYTGE